MTKKEVEGTKIQDLMVEDVAYVTVPGTREEIIEILKEKYVSGVPVVKDGKVAGVVTREDLLKNPDEEQTALLMTRDPITISSEATIGDAAKLLLSHGIRRLPVVTEDKLIGIVSVADIMRKIAEMNCKETIGDYIEDETTAIWDEMPLSVAGRIMELAGLKAAAVLNSKLELVGIITDRDLINATIIEHRLEHSDLSLGSDEDVWTWGGMRDTMGLYYSISKIGLPKKLVRDAMVRDVITATRSSDVSECAKKMSQNKFDQLPVISTRGKLISLLLDRDLLKVFR